MVFQRMFFFQVAPPKSCLQFSFPPIHATCPTNFNVLDLMILMTPVSSTNHNTSH